MKLENDIHPDKIVLERQNEVKKGIKHIGRLKTQPGQRLFELNTKTKMINIIDVNEDVAVDIKGKVHKKIVLKEDCLYTPALNLKNAEKKFIKMLS